MSIFEFKGRGQLHAARGDGEAARKDFDAAIAIFEDLASRLELGRTLVLRDGGTDLHRSTAEPTAPPPHAPLDR